MLARIFPAYEFSARKLIMKTAFEYYDRKKTFFIMLEYSISGVFVFFSALPHSLLTCHQYAQFIAQYRQLTAETLLSEGTDPYSAGSFSFAPFE